MYQLGLPDGSYLEVDDALPVEKAREIAIQKFPDLFPDRQVSFGERVGTRVKEGIMEVPDLARAAGAVVGIGDYEHEKKTSPVPQARLREFFDRPKDVTGEIVGGGIGSILPSLGGTAAGAGIGATLGSVVPGIGTGLGALAGAAIGGIGSAAILNTGDIYQGLLEEGVDADRARPIAALITLPVTALDVVSLGALSRYLPFVWKPLAKSVGKAIAKEEGVNLTEDQLFQTGQRYLSSKLGGVMEKHPILAPGGIEAGTEMAQQAIQEGANAYASGKDFLTADRLENIATAGLMGGFGGGLMGGIGSVMPGFPKVAPEDSERALRERDLPQFTDEEIQSLREVSQERQSIIPELMASSPITGPTLALPAPKETTDIPDGLPPEKAEVAKQTANPIGTFSAAEVGPDVAERINGNRQERGEAPLATFTVEDLVHEGASRAEVERVLGMRTNFNPSRKVSADDILRAAAKKNIVTSNYGFKDFLKRVAGYPDLSTMSATQKQAVLSVIEGMERFPTITSFPVQSRTSDLYNRALDSIRSNGSASLRNLSKATGLNEKTNANELRALRQEMVDRGDLTPQKNLTGQIEYKPRAELAPLPQAESKAPGTYVGDMQIATTETDGKKGYSVYQIQQEPGKPRKRTLLSTFPSEDLAIADAVGRMPLDEVENLAALDGDSRSNEQKNLGTPSGISNANRLIAQRARERLQTEGTTTQAARVARTSGPQQIKGGVTTIEAPKGEGAAAAERIKAMMPKVTGAKKLSSDTLRKLDILGKTLSKRLNELGLKEVNLDIVGTLQQTIKDSEGNERKITPNAQYWNAIISIALDSKGGFLRALNHESIHALREFGLIPEKDWKVLTRKIDSEKWLDRPFGTFKTSVRARYRAQGLSQDALYEEAVADMFAAFSSGDLYYPGFFTSLARRISNFFEALGNALRGLGFRTGDDIFDRLDTQGANPDGTTSRGVNTAPKFAASDWTVEQAQAWATHEITGRGFGGRPLRFFYNENEGTGVWQYDGNMWGPEETRFMDEEAYQEVRNADTHNAVFTDTALQLRRSDRSIPVSRTPAEGKHIIMRNPLDDSIGWFSESNKWKVNSSFRELKFSVDDAEASERATIVLTDENRMRVFFDSNTNQAVWMGHHDERSSEGWRNAVFISDQDRIRFLSGPEVFGKQNEDGTVHVISGVDGRDFGVMETQDSPGDKSNIIFLTKKPDAPRPDYMRMSYLNPTGRWGIDHRFRELKFSVDDTEAEERASIVLSDEDGRRVFYDEKNGESVWFDAGNNQTSKDWRKAFFASPSAQREFIDGGTNYAKVVDGGLEMVKSDGRPRHGGPRRVMPLLKAPTPKSKIIFLNSSEELASGYKRVTYIGPGPDSSWNIERKFKELKFSMADETKRATHIINPDASVWSRVWYNAQTKMAATLSRSAGWGRPNQFRRRAAGVISSADVAHLDDLRGTAATEGTGISYKVVTSGGHSMLHVYKNMDMGNIELAIPVRRGVDPKAGDEIVLGERDIFDEDRNRNFDQGILLQRVRGVATTPLGRRLARESFKELKFSVPDSSFGRDEEGKPILVGREYALTDPEKWETFAGMTFYQHAIRDKKTLEEVGNVTLGWSGDHPTQLLYISTRKGGTRKGIGEDVVRAILDHNGNDHPLLAMYILDDAEPFWRKMGGSFFKGDEGATTHASLELKTYLTARPRDEAARESDEGGEGSAQADQRREQGGGQLSLGDEQRSGKNPYAGSEQRVDADARFREAEADARYSLPDEPWYYSALTKAITDVPDSRKDLKFPQHWIGYINQVKGVKKEEIESSGVIWWLKWKELVAKQKEVPALISRDEIVNYLTKDGVTVSTTFLGEPAREVPEPTYLTELPPTYAVEEHKVRIEPKAKTKRINDEYERILNDLQEYIKQKAHELGGENSPEYKAWKDTVTGPIYEFYNFVAPSRGASWQVRQEYGNNPDAGIALFREWVPGSFPASVVGRQSAKFRTEYVVWDNTDPDNRSRMFTGDTESDARDGALVILNENIRTKYEEEVEKARDRTKRTQYEAYTIDDRLGIGPSKGYREVLFHSQTAPRGVPSAESIGLEEVTEDNFRIVPVRGKYAPTLYRVENNVGEVIAFAKTPEEAQANIESHVGSQMLSERRALRIQQSHYGNLGHDMIGWSRISEMQGKNGTRVLFVHELQSDVAQRYRNAKVTEKDLEVEKIIPGETEDHPKEYLFKFAYAGKTKTGRVSGLGRTEEEARVNATELANISGPVKTSRPPEYPFITTSESWLRLVLGRLAVYAAQRGFNEVRFATGRQQWIIYGGLNEHQKLGQVGFYDSVLPRVLNRFVKDIGGKSGEAGFVNRSEIPALAERTKAYGQSADVWAIVEKRSDEKGKSYDQIIAAYEGSRASAMEYVNEIRSGQHEKLVQFKDKPLDVVPAFQPEEQLGFAITPELKEKLTGNKLPLFFSLSDSMPTAERTAVGRDVAYSMLDIAQGIDKFIKPLGKLDQIRTTFQDRMLPVKRLQEELKQRGGTITEAMDSYLREELFHGRVGDRIGSNEKVLYKPLVESLRRNHVALGDFEDWLYSRHAPERNSYLRRVMGVADGSGMSDAAAARVKADVEAKYGRAMMEELGDKFDLIIEDTNKVRQQGFLTDVYDPNSGFKHYAPLRSFEEDPDEKPNIPAWRRTGLLADVRGKEDPKMQGRKTKGENILAAAIMQNEMAIIRAEKNKVGKSFIDMVRANEGKMSGVQIIDENPNPDVWQIDADGVIRVRQSPYYYDKSTLVVKEADPQRPGKIREVALRIDDQRVADAIKGINPQSSEVGGAIVATLGKLNRWLSLVNTGMNPEFLVSNLFRDLQTAGVVLQGTDYKGTALKMVSQIPQAVKGIWKVIRNDDVSNDPWVEAFREMQGAGGRTYFLGIKDVGDKMREIQKMMGQVKEGNALTVKNALRSIESLIEDVNQVFENATRLSVYKIARDSGASKDKAASLAKNITVNFTRGGQVKTLMNSMYLFYNASLQGSFVIMNSLKSPTVRKIVGGIVIGGMLMDALNRAISDDDDDGENAYDKIMRAKPYVGEHFFVVMIPGSKKYMAVPMPYGFNAFYNMGRNFSAAMAGRVKPLDAAKSILFTGVDAFNPLGGTESFLTFVAPTVADPFIELATNKNFAGQNIVPATDPYSPYKKPDSQLFWSNTAVPYVKVAEWMNKLTGGTTAIPGMVDVSPETLEYWLDYAGGATAKFVERTGRMGYAALTGDLDKVEVGQTPFLRKAVGSLDNRANVETYYERAASVLEAQAELKAAIAERDPARIRRAMTEFAPQLAMANFFERTDKRLAEMRSQKRRIIADDSIPSEYKRTLVDRLEKNMDAVLLNANRVYLQTVVKKKAA